MKRVLMIAYHFPPLAGSSGIQRTLRFSRYLPAFGWEPVILTTHIRAYERCSDDQLVDIADGMEVIRAPAWDTARHFSMGGRYPGFLARPDRWSSWWPFAVLEGMRAIRRLRPQALWSTYPIATAHRIGASLARLSGLPWIADFRDPMAQEGYPEDPATWRAFARIEQRAISQARLSTFASPGAVADYQRRYPTYADRLLVLENGYDEEAFEGLSPGRPLNPGFITLLHSGLIYPSERDPTSLIVALARLRSEHPAAGRQLRLRFRAPVHDTLLASLADKHGVSDAIEIMPPTGYRAALQEMLSADALLILQAANCNQQIPAKLYEYLRASRPIIALTDPAGDTAATLRAAGLSSIAPLNDATAIQQLIARYIATPNHGTLPASDVVAKASRRERTRQLAHLLERAQGA